MAEAGTLQFIEDWDEQTVYPLAALQVAIALQRPPHARRARWRNALRPLPENVKLDAATATPDGLLVCLRPGPEAAYVRRGETAEAACDRIAAQLEAVGWEKARCYLLVPHASHQHDILVFRERLLSSFAAETLVCESDAARALWGVETQHVIAPGLDPLEHPPCPQENAQVLTFCTGRDAPRSALADTVAAIDASGRIDDALPFAVADFAHGTAYGHACRRHYAQFLSSHGILLAMEAGSAHAQTVREAMLCGLAVVAEDCAANAEVIAHEENGFLAEDEADAAAILKRLREDSALRNTIGAAARATAMRRFHINHVLNAWEQVLPPLAVRP